MAQRSLVTTQIDDGLALGRRLVADGHEVAALFWALDYDDEDVWTFYVVMPASDEDPRASESLVREAARRERDSWIQPRDVRVIGPGNDAAAPSADGSFLA